MNYTIAYTIDVATGNVLSYERNNNEYTVTYCKTTKKFDTAAKAARVYLKISGWILLSCYNDEQRESYLLTGTMK